MDKKGHITLAYFDQKSTVLAKNPYLLKPLLLCGAAMLAVLLVAFVVWYGLVQIRIFFRI